MSFTANRMRQGAAGTGGDYEIDSSLRFNDDDSAYLSWTPSTNGTSTDVFTIAFWCKRGTLGTDQYLWDIDETTINFNSSDKLAGNLRGTESGNYLWSTNSVFRDPSAWYHVVAAYDSTQATDTNRFKLYVNGVIQTFSSISYMPQHREMKDTQTHHIGYEGSGYSFDGLFADYYMIDGSALAPTDFGLFDATYGHWKAKEYAGSYTGNSFYLPFTNDTTNDHFNTVLYTGDNSSYRKISGFGFQPDFIWAKSRPANSGWNLADSLRGGTNILTSLDNRAEFYTNTILSFHSDGYYVGDGNGSDINKTGESTVAWGWKAGGALFTDSSSSKHVITHHGDTHHSTTQKKIGATGIKFDGTTGQHLSIPDHDDWNFGTGDWTAETWVYATGINGSGFSGYINMRLSSDDYAFVLGQNTTGAVFYLKSDDGTAIIAGGSTGTLSLNTWNHIVLTRDGNTVRSYLNGVASTTWSCTGKSFDYSGDRVYVGLGGHSSYYMAEGFLDEIRISNTCRYPSGTSFTPTTSAFTSDANTKLLTHSDNDLLNTSGTIDATVSANPEQGFSIVSYVGAGGTKTVGHGLSSPPELLIVKQKYALGAGTNGWYVGSKYLTGATPFKDGHFLTLETTSAMSTQSNDTLWGDLEPTSSVFGVGSWDTVNRSGGYEYIAYCWHSVAGYSKIGNYTGNNNASGPVVTTGFRVAWLMVKSVGSAEPWLILDNARDITNTRSSVMNPSLSGAENGPPNSDYHVDFNADGFQIKNTQGAMNSSSTTYIYMAFADTSAVGDVTNDQSGLKNHWSGVNLTASDVMLDSPTNNFATLNPLNNAMGATISEGNLKAVNTSATDKKYFASMGMLTGKWYWEIEILSLGNRNALGVVDDSQSSTPLMGTHWARINPGNSSTSTSGVANTTVPSFTNGDILTFAFDADNGKLFYAKNAAAAGSGTGDFHSLATTTYFPFNRETGGASTNIWNFGQDATFGGNKSPITTYSDGEYGEFHYQPPAGFKSLCTQNLPNPAVVPGEHFNAVTYTGNGSTTQSISDVGFQPDLVWTKSRSLGYDHQISDSVRGGSSTTTGKHLSTNLSASEPSNANGHVQSFDSGGFTARTGSSGGAPAAGTHENNVTYVAWNWKAGGTAVSNTNGSITSSVSANTDAGFSIVSYTGNGTSGATVGHGLSPNAPELVIVKSRSLSGKNWPTYHIDEGNTKRIKLNSTDAAGASSAWNNTTPSSSLVTLGSQSEVNTSGATQIMYCFHSVDGYSKIGLYFGNGSADGPFIFTGFQPKYILWKQSRESGENWRVIDDTRSPYNQANKHLAPSSSSAESTETGLDFLSNGFKWRNADWHQNQNGKTYIYMAFAEYPFKYSTAR